MSFLFGFLMNNIDQFRQMWTTLVRTSNEHPPLLARVSSEQIYQRIFAKANLREQQLLAEYKQKALDSVRELSVLPSDSPSASQLRQIAIHNLRMIRHTQQLIALFDDFDESVNADYFRKVISEIPVHDRIDAVSKALSGKKILVCPFKRKKLVELLVAIAPEQRTSTKDALITMLAKCPGRDYENMIYGFLTLVRQEERGPFAQNLSHVLAILDVGNWQGLAEQLAQSTEARRAQIIYHVSQIVPHDLHLNSAMCAAIIRSVKTHLMQEEVLTSSARLTRMCTDPSYIPLMIQVLAQQTPQNQTSVVNFLHISFPVRLDSHALYEHLRRAIAMTAERREALQLVVSQIQNNPLRRLLTALQLMDMAYEMNDLEMQFSTMALDRYRLEVHREDLTNCPLEVLNTLYTLIQKEEKKALKITYIGEQAVDVGGPAQEFLTTLVEEVCKTLQPTQHTETLFRPKISFIKPEHTKALEQLGALLIFCVHSPSKYVIGRQLNPALFVALCKLTQDLVACDFDALAATHFEALFAIYEAMNAIDEDDLAGLLRIKAYIAENSAPIEPVIEAMREDLEPCILLYKGMLKTPFAVEILAKMKPEELEETLQGTLEPEMVVKQLAIKAAQAPQEWIKEWILGLSPAKTKLFLRLITGTPALGKRMLNIEFFETTLQFSTCTQTLTLPVSACDSKRSMIYTLEDALKTSLRFNTM